MLRARGRSEQYGTLTSGMVWLLHSSVQSSWNYLHKRGTVAENRGAHRPQHSLRTYKQLGVAGGGETFSSAVEPMVRCLCAYRQP